MGVGGGYYYLRMNLELSIPGGLHITMVDLFKRSIKDFPENIPRNSYIPVLVHLFKVWDKGGQKLLDDERATTFHHAVAQLLCTTSRGQKYVQTSIEFLTTQVFVLEK